MPQSLQKNILLRHNFSPSPKWHNDINFAFNQNERNGGSVDNSFPLKLNESNFGVFGKSGVVFKNPAKSIGFQYSYNQYEFEGDIANKKLKSNANELYLNLIHQNYISTTDHIITGGLSFTREESDDRIDQYYSSDTLNNYYKFTREIPGAFVEYNGTLSDNDNLTLGLRSDYYQNDWRISPRINYRHAFNAKTVFRTGAGKAFRSNYLIAENYNLMINTRQITGLQNLTEAEESWSIFSSIWRKFKIGFREGDILIEHHYQQFQNRYLAHFVDANELNIQKHNKALNQSFLVQVNYEIIPSMDLKVAYKYNEQKANDLNQGFNNIWLIPHNRSFVNLSYETRNEWLFNTTLNRIGSQNLPQVNISDITNIETIDAFYLLSFQVSKSHKNWRFYAGVENALDVIQEKAWLGLADNKPEASISWQSPIGRSFHIGINYQLMKKQEEKK